jgi:Williams-Beuren syndrome DDT (WSD), D-TOX E motif
MGQDRHKNRYWLFAGGKGRGFYAGKVLVENPSKHEWGYYNRQQVEALVDLLNPKGTLFPLLLKLPYRKFSIQ